MRLDGNPSEQFNGNHIERIWPTQANLEEYLSEFRDHRQRYEFAQNYVNGKVIADIACGAGYGSFMLSDVATSVTGFDISEEALSHASKYFSRSNLTFKHASKILENKFDVIVSFETIEHMTEEDGDRFLQDLHSSLIINGTLIISTPLNRNSLSQRINVTPYHLREYNEKEFARKLDVNGFQVDRWFGQWNSVTETLAKPIALGVSLGGIVRSGVHRLLPDVLRRPITKLLLGNKLEKVNDSVRIIPDDLSGASVQIAVCRRV